MAETPYDLQGAGLGDTEQDTPSLINTLRSQGSMPSAAIQMLMQPQGNPYMEALAGGVALTKGVPNPVTAQRAAGQPQMAQMFRLLMMNQVEQRRQLMDQWKMEVDARKAKRQQDIDAYKAQKDAETLALNKERLQFDKGKEYFTLANQFGALAEKTDDPILRQKWAENITEGYKLAGMTGDLPKNYILSTVKKDVSKETKDEIWRLSIPGKDGKPAATPEEIARVTNAPLPLVQEMHKIAQKPGIAENLGIDLDALGTKQLDRDIKLFKVAGQKYGIQEAPLADATITALKGLGVDDWHNATDDQWKSAKQIAEKGIADKKEADRQQAKRDQLALFEQEQKLRMGMPLKPQEIAKVMEPFTKARLGLDTTSQMRDWLDKLPKDFFPTGDSWWDVKSAAARQKVYYEGHPEWKNFAALFNEFSIGFARGQLDDKATRSVKAFEKTIGLVDTGTVPPKEAFNNLLDYYERQLKNNATSSLKNLTIGRQYPDLVQRATEEVGKYLDPNTMKRATNPSPLTPPEMPSMTSTAPPGPSGKPVQTFPKLPDPAQFKGKKVRNTDTGEMFISDGFKWDRVQ